MSSLKTLTNAWTITTYGKSPHFADPMSETISIYFLAGLTTLSQFFMPTWPLTSPSSRWYRFLNADDILSTALCLHSLLPTRFFWSKALKEAFLKDLKLVLSLEKNLPRFFAFSVEWFWNFSYLTQTGISYVSFILSSHNFSLIFHCLIMCFLDKMS